MYDKYFNASLILASKFGMKLDRESNRHISSPTIGGCCKTAEVPAVAALYERRFFADSTECRRSAKRKRDSAQPQEIDRRYS